MNKADFEKLFILKVAEAFRVANLKIPPNLKFEVYGGGTAKRLLPLKETIEALYISEELYYRVITICVKSLQGDFATVFVGISGHEPSGFKETRNDPEGSGPFHVTAPISI